MSTNDHGTGAASPWIQRWAHLVAPGGTVLDLACGQGRHSHWFAERGHFVVALDKSETALQALETRVAAGQVTTVLADIETQPWPLLQHDAPQGFDAIVVTNYLWRPLIPTILQSLAPGGVLLYETFAHGNASVGKPSRPDFLLQPGELLRICADLHIVAFEDGFCAQPDRFIQHIAAVREDNRESADGMPAATPVRHWLDRP